MKNSILILIATILTTKVASECWSEKLGYECCPSGTEVFEHDEDGDWGLYNNDWCGIVNTTTKTKPTKTIPTKKYCTAYTYPADVCTRKGGTVTSYTSDGCPIPTCTFDSCWAEELGYPCCDFYFNNVYTIDEDGEWGIVDGEWCGIRPFTTKTSDITKTPEVTSSPKPCPVFSFASSQCTQKGGTVISTTKSGCPTPTCFFKNRCWSEEYYYPCCDFTNDKVVYSNEDGEWGQENGDWCGIRSYITKTPDITTTSEITQTPEVTTPPTKTIPTKKNCPTFTFPADVCTRKGGILTGYTSDGCPTPTCTFDSCWSEKFGYPCCSFLNNEMVYSDENGKWGNDENGNWCGIRPYAIKTLDIITKTSDITKTPEVTASPSCSEISFPSALCTQKGGTVTSTTKSGCPTPTCVFKSRCWSDEYYYPCCDFTNTKVVYSNEDGQWGQENGEWCGIRPDVRV